MEHTVSRADLEGSDDSSIASPELEALERLRGFEEFEFVIPEAKAPAQASNNDDGEDEGLDFQLFAAPKGPGETAVAATGAATKIRLRSPSLDPEKVGFVRPHRNQSYYLASPLDEVAKRRLAAAALSGEQILAQASLPWPGSAYAWKVLHLPRSGLSKDIPPDQLHHLPRLTGIEQAKKKRTRPGKKYRIKLRKRAEVLRVQKEARRAAEEAKEAAEREKRTRRNREKKVKRRAKEKAARVEGRAGDADDGGEGDGG